MNKQVAETIAANIKIIAVSAALVTIEPDATARKAEMDQIDRCEAAIARLLADPATWTPKTKQNDS